MRAPGRAPAGTAPTKPDPEENARATAAVAAATSVPEASPDAFPSAGERRAKSAPAADVTTMSASAILASAAAASVALAALALAPLLARQGRRVRARTPRLPEPPGARAGERGDGAPLAVLFVGDSSAAGVGVASQEEALLGRTLARLAPGRRVRYRLVARTGWRTEDALARLETLPAERFDVAVVALGVNDVTARVPLASWLARQRRLRETLVRRFGVRLVIVSGLPPMGRFPALPQPLRGWLGHLARRYDRALERALVAVADARFVPLREFSEAAAMSDDGFHPGASVYDEWAGRVVAAIRHDDGARRDGAGQRHTAANA